MTRYSNTRQSLSMLLVVAVATIGHGFVLPSLSTSTSSSSSSQLWAAKMDRQEIKRKLEEYLEKRIELNADELAKKYVEQGRVVGGTKGNKILDFVSGAPVKERIIEQIPNIFDYDELSKYGYSSLVTPIMDLGGRRSFYELMEMEAPPLPGPPPKKSATKLVFDRTGEEDKARYTGLKMGQALDDDAMAQALELYYQKAKLGKVERAKLMEEEYERPFADKRNTGPQPTPDWTAEKLDEYTKMQGQAMSWARRAREGEFVKDPYEYLELPFGMQLYCILTAFYLSAAFGRSTSPFLETTLGIMDHDSISQLTNLLQAPGWALVVASLGSSVFCGFFLAPERNRSSFVWAVKGLTGGPLAIRDIVGLESLITRGEQEEQAKLKLKL